MNDDERLQVVPYGGIPDDEGVRIYAIKIATGDTAYSFGFDDSRERWKQLAAVEADDLAVADERLDAVLDEWVQATYGRRFEVLRPV